MAKQLGPTFGDEVIAAGLGGLPFSWGATSDDIFGRENLTDEQNTTLDGVIEAHDPTKQPPPVPDALAEAQRANARLDAGIEAATETAKAIERLPNMPAKTGEVTREEFDALVARVDMIQEAVTAMVEAQATDGN